MMADYQTLTAISEREREASPGNGATLQKESHGNGTAAGA
jgi:hypothetical protein